MKKLKKCKIVFGFNDLGMLFFACEIHGKLNSKYQRFPIKCRQQVIRVFEELFWLEAKTGTKKRPIKLSPRGRKTFPRLIGLKAYEVKSQTKKLWSPDLIRVKIIGKKTINTYSKNFWE